jgi:hydroxyacylglutathione hydrolase
MLLERIYDEDLAQTSYVIGCQAKGEAIVIDPRRDLTPYLDLAARNGMRIVAVAETHIHADYLSGSRELAAATGASLYDSGEGGEDWQYEFEAERLRHGDAIRIGNLGIEARHTPGHTPEHLSFLVTDGAFSDRPGYLFSGDFVFVGDLGRPDLLGEAAGGVNTRFWGAHKLYESLRDEFLALPDHVQVHPAHGAGSACGRALGAIPSTTVGYERENAWWAGYLRDHDEEGFVQALLDGQPDAHAYFARMKRQNKLGPAILGEQAKLVELDSQTLSQRLAADEVIFVDTRPNADVHTGTVLRSLNVPGVEKAATYAAWVYDPEREHRPLVVLAENEAMAREFRAHVVRVGIDSVIGFTSSLASLPLWVPPVISRDQLETTDRALLLDVRNRGEYETGHIPGAVQLSGGRVMWRLEELPGSGKIVTYCQSGVRNSVASSALRRAGYDVVELDGSYAGWLEYQADKEMKVA